MKSKLIVLTCLLVCMILPSEINAQVVNPDLTRMRLLLAKIADCTNDQKDLEAELAAMEKLKPNISLELYNQAKKNLGIANRCKAAAQRQYDDLRADYEGWFGESTSGMPVGGEWITALLLHNRMAIMLSGYSGLYGIFGTFQEPKH